MKRFSAILCAILVILSVSVVAFAAEGEAGEEETQHEGYLPPEQFFALEDDYSVTAYAIQTTPNTPVTSASGLKGILIDLFGEYSPQITQLRYQVNSNSNYTYVNQIDRDVPWIASACIFGLVLFCVFRLGGVVLSKL